MAVTGTTMICTTGTDTTAMTSMTSMEVGSTDEDSGEAEIGEHTAVLTATIIIFAHFFHC